MFFQVLNFVLFLINNISLGVPSCSIWNFTHFSVAHKTYPSSRCVTAANFLCSNVNIFRRPLRPLIFETDLAIITRSFVLRFNYLANLNFNFLTYLLTRSDFTDMWFSLSHKSIFSICSGYNVLKWYIIVLKFDIIIFFSWRDNSLVGYFHYLIIIMCL